ncbi:hypothetical protein RFI_31203, partial [Reticulomyxa filosa]
MICKFCKKTCNIYLIDSINFKFVITIESIDNSLVTLNCLKSPFFVSTGAHKLISIIIALLYFVLTGAPQQIHNPSISKLEKNKLEPSLKNEHYWNNPFYSKKTNKDKHFVIESCGNERLIFRPSQLREDGRMSEAAKEANWQQLLQTTKDQLKLAPASTFLFVRKDSNDDQIDNDDDLMDIWNELVRNKKIQCYVFQL